MAFPCVRPHDTATCGGVRYMLILCDGYSRTTTSQAREAVIILGDPGAVRGVEGKLWRKDKRRRRWGEGGGEKELFFFPSFSPRSLRPHDLPLGPPRCQLGSPTSLPTVDDSALFLPKKFKDPTQCLKVHCLYCDETRRVYHVTRPNRTQQDNRVPGTETSSSTLERNRLSGGEKRC